MKARIDEDISASGETDADKEKTMTTATMKTVQDTEKAQKFFAAKNAFTTGPVEVSYHGNERRLRDVDSKRHSDRS